MDNLTGEIKFTEIVHQELDLDPDPFFSNPDPQHCFSEQIGT